MKAIFKGNKFTIQWAITDAVTSLPFDFTGMFVEFVLYSDSYHGRISGATVSGNKMQAEIPADTLPVGIYNIVCDYRTRKENHGHCICRRAFQITRNQEFVTRDDKIVLESFAAPLQLENMDINYIGHYPDGASLPDQDRPAWALAGNLKEAKPWFFYTAGSVPPGYQAGWNDLSAVLGTYDLTADKVSIYDFNLVTEYNVSRNHIHTTKVFSKDWSVTTKYYTEFADYISGKTYAPCSKVNMPGYKEHSFMANKATSEAPFTIVDGTNEFSFSEAVALVPKEYRFAGMRVTFINSMTHLAETWYFNGGTWENVGNWQKINFGVGEDQLTAEELFKEKFEMPKLIADMAIADEHGNRIPDTYVKRQAVANYIKSVYQELFIANPPLITEGYITPEMLSEETKQMLEATGQTINNLPDGEDLQSVHGVLKFADKEYNPNSYDGLGKRFVRRNIVNGVNTLVQSQVKWANTLYIFRYDHDLQGKTITIPEGCTLKFESGKIYNGTIILNDTLVRPYGGNLKDYIDCKIEGTFRKGQVLYSEEYKQTIVWTGEKWKCSYSVLFRVFENKLQQSVDDGSTWENVSDHIASYFRFVASQSDPNSIGKIQISQDNKEWSDLSPEFTNYLKISDYVATTSALPSNPVLGTIYGVGTDPQTGYELYVYTSKGWVNNGTFTSIAAGVVQETGNSETEVMSQKAVTEKLSELGSEVDRLNADIKKEDYIGDNSIIIEDDENGEEIVAINNDGVSVKKLCVKKNGNKTDVMELIDSKTSDEDFKKLDKNFDKEIPNDTDESIVILDNDGNEVVRVDNEGLKVKKLQVQNGIKYDGQILDFIGLNTITTCCHRGLCGKSAPENSIHAITNAYMQGMKVVECDIHSTADGQWVVIHDNTLNRTFVNSDGTSIAGTTSLKSLTLEQIKTNYVYNTPISKYKTSISTFEEWLERISELGLVPMLHGVNVEHIATVQKYVGDNFIYMGKPWQCPDIRQVSSGCFIMLQNAEQQDVDSGAILDIEGLIAEMKSIGGLVGYSSMNYNTFSDDFIKALRKNGLYWQLSSENGNNVSNAISRGCNFILVDNWCNKKLSYTPLFTLSNDLSNIEFQYSENGCAKYLSGSSFNKSFEISGNNVNVVFEIKGNITLNIDGKSQTFGDSNDFKVFEFGFNTESSNVTMSIIANTDILIRELIVLQS